LLLTLYAGPRLYNKLLTSRIPLIRKGTPHIKCKHQKNAKVEEEKLTLGYKELLEQRKKLLNALEDWCWRLFALGWDCGPGRKWLQFLLSYFALFTLCMSRFPSAFLNIFFLLYPPIPGKCISSTISLLHY